MPFVISLYNDIAFIVGFFNMVSKNHTLFMRKAEVKMVYFCVQKLFFISKNGCTQPFSESFRFVFRKLACHMLYYVLQFKQKLIRRKG